MIEIRKQDCVATLIVNRPEALNALNAAVLDGLEEALTAVAQSPDVSVVILTGAGDKAFVAGADIKAMATLNAREAHDFSLRGQRLITLIESMPQPVIAVVNGYALGGGFELALACDFIYASEDAKFGFPEVTLGIMPGFGGTQKLSRLVGVNMAKELIFTGKMIDAKKAKEIGAVNKVLPHIGLMKVAEETARTICANGGVGVAYAKKAINSGANMPLAEALRYEAGLFGNLFSTEDQKEGMQAFIEKRKAGFKNC